MFAIEAMALSKPVICNYRTDLEKLYRVAGLYGADEEIPLINSCPLTIKDTLRNLYAQRDSLGSYGQKGRAYVLKHHSIDAIASIFGPIAEQVIGKPSLKEGVSA